MKQEKEFDRSRCFMFFESYLESAEKYQVQFGTEVAFNYLIGVAKYALYQEESEDGMTNALVSALKNTIDSGQEKRSKGFSGENFDQSRLVAEYYRDHPEASQRAIADAIGVSKTKVQKTLAKIKESGMEINTYIRDVINPNLNNNDNSNSNSNLNPNGETKTETSHGSPDELADAQTEASTMQEDRELEELTDEELISLKKGFRARKKYSDLQKEFNLSYGIADKSLGSKIDSILADRKEMKEKGELIPLSDGTPSCYYTGDFKIDTEELSDYYMKMTGVGSYYRFDKTFVDNWFLEEYGYIHEKQAS